MRVFFPRKIYPHLKKHLSRRQVTVLTGLRRSGKTTLIKHLLPEIKSSNKLYLDLQNLSHREIFAEPNYDNILLQLRERGLKTTSRAYLAIDEIQLLPEITGIIKYLYDNYPIKFIVTGSSSYYLKNLFSESLSGRKTIFELFPLDFGEFLTFKKVPFLPIAGPHKLLKQKFNPLKYHRLGAYYEEYVAYGGFPEVVLAASVGDKKRLLEDIISSYINIDIKILADFRQSAEIYKLIKMLAGRVGTKLDYSKLSRLTGLSRTTVINYAELFEKTYLIARLAVHTKNPDREIVKATKLYFSDPGLVGILADVASGTKFENAVFCQLRQLGKISYYALKTGHEIDFVVDKKLALEAKETPTSTDLSTLAALAKSAGLKTSHLIGRYSSPKFNNYLWGGDIR